MEKLKSSLQNMVLVLFVITLVAGLSLGSVYELTKKPIELSKQKKTLKAIKDVTSDFDNEPSKDKFIKHFDKDKEDIIIYKATKDSKVVSYAVQTYTKKGFNGVIKLMIGLNPDLTIRKISVVEQSETPGLGTKMDSEKFLKQFNDVNLNSFNFTVSKDGGEVDAITAATISSRAFCDAVVKAKEVVNEYLKK